MSSGRQGTTTPSEGSTPVSSVVTKSTAKVKHYTDKELCQENFDLIAQVIWLIDLAGLWSEDNTFTFPDGETWVRQEDDSNE